MHDLYISETNILFTATRSEFDGSNKSQWQLNAGKVSGTNRRGHFETYQNDK